MGTTSMGRMATKQENVAHLSYKGIYDASPNTY